MCCIYKTQTYENASLTNIVTTSTEKSTLILTISMGFLINIFISGQIGWSILHLESALHTTAFLRD
jgi:hypothetical protein